MTLEVINTGTFPNDATGDTLQTAFNKCNDNFGQLNGTLAPFTPTEPGLVPASGGGTTTALRADGTFTATFTGTWTFPVIDSTTVNATTGNITTVNATNVNTTNLTTVTYNVTTVSAVTVAASSQITVGASNVPVYNVTANIVSYYGQTAAEIAAGVTPVNYAYAPGDIRRYGASLSASAATNTAAIQNAQSGNFGVIYAPPGTFSYTFSSVTNCTAYGLNALSKNGTGGTPGNNNTAFGVGALANLNGGATNPSGSTAIGQGALQLSNGATMTAVGANALANDLIGTDCTAVGATAGFSQNGTVVTGNNYFGFQCGYFITTGNSNSLFGNYAGGGINGPTGTGITTGSNNCGFGGGTLGSVGSGNNNCAFGVGALDTTTGSGNLGIGFFAGNHATSSNEFYIDNQDRGTNATERTNALIYGAFGATPANQLWTINARCYLAVGTVCTLNNAPTLASAATIAPSAAITFVSGTAAVAIITVPSWMGNGGSIKLIPTSIFTWGTGGNIALAGTAVVSKTLEMTYDTGTGKWYPSYIS